MPPDCKEYGIATHTIVFFAVSNTWIRPTTCPSADLSIGTRCTHIVAKFYIAMCVHLELMEIHFFTHRT